MIVQVLPSTTLASGISVNDFATYLKQTYADDQTVIDLCFNASVQYCEGILGLSLTQKTVKVISDSWDDGEIPLDIFGTLSSITINYYDTSNVNQTLSPLSSERWLERTGINKCVLVIDTTLPSLYDRDDAVRITLTLGADDTFVSQYNMVIFQLGAYFYDCRTNDKEPSMTVVDKMLMAMRQKEF